jgi:predicted O-methyltransferase YrrM
LLKSPNHNRPSYSDLVAFQVGNGCDEKQVRLGSIPKENLDRAVPLLRGNGLQIGGFVGVSHCYIAWHLRDRGTLWTVDPNITHRGIHNPFGLAQSMARHFRLLSNSVLITNFANEQLEIFKRCGMAFDFIILDGNHDEHQVQHEVAECRGLLKDGGFLIMDDVDTWTGPKNIYNKTSEGYEKMQVDSGLGFMRKT